MAVSTLFKHVEAILTWTKHGVSKYPSTPLSSMLIPFWMCQYPLLYSAFMILKVSNQANYRRIWMTTALTPSGLYLHLRAWWTWRTSAQGSTWARTIPRLFSDLYCIGDLVNSDRYLIPRLFCSLVPVTCYCIKALASRTLRRLSILMQCNTMPVIIYGGARMWKGALILREAACSAGNIQKLGNGVLKVSCNEASQAQTLCQHCK